MGKLKLLWDGLVKYKTFIVMVVTVVVTVIMLQTCQENKDLKAKIEAEKAKTDQNIAALTEDLQEYKDKYDNKGYIKPIAQLTKEELKQYNPELYKELEKELGKVVVLEKIKLVYVDSGYVKNFVNKLSENQYSVDFDYQSKDKVFDISGRSTFGAYATPIDSPAKYELKITPGLTYIDSAKVQFGIVTGIRQDKDNIYRIFVKPSSPNINITSIEGDVVSDYLDLNPTVEKPRKFGVSAYLGYGATIDTKSRTVAMGPSGGVALTYTIFSFGKKK
jgi:hypothetical protein